MGSRKSNRDICDFYKKKNRHEVTGKYFNAKIWNRRANPYIQLYEDFNYFSSLRDLEDSESYPRKDNECLYRVLQAWKEPEKASFPIEIYTKVDKDKYDKVGEITEASRMPDLDFLRDIDIDILNPANNPGGEANQKWHLYVGVFAYSVVCDKKFKWNNNFRKYSCLVLRLWMIENAEIRETDEINLAIDDEKKKISLLVKSAFDKLILCV